MSAETRALVKEFSEADEDERLEIVQRAENTLSNTQMKSFRKEIRSIEKDEEEGKKLVASAGDQKSDEGTSKDTPATSATIDKGKKPATDPPQVTTAVVEAFWKTLEGMTGDDLIDDQTVKDFQYVGFDPNVIMKSIITKGRVAKRTNDQILEDISKMCTIAIIKGSITELNLKKMSDEGKAAYGVLEARYNLKKGGSKGVDPEIITIARVGAAFPGAISKILMSRPDFAKTFAGPFGTKVLPPYLKHQSAAACIPEGLSQDLKSYLLGLISAYTSDQSKVISKTKDKPEEIFERQENFVSQTHSSMYPSEPVRIALFKTWTIISDFDKLNAVAVNIGKITKDFEAISKDDLTKAFNAI